MDDVQTSTVQPPYEKLTDVAYDIEAEKSPEQKQIELEQNKQDYQLAALHDHPGWEQIRDGMKADVDRIRSLKDIKMNEYTDKELGEVVRGEFRVANKLEEYLNKVDEAVKAVAGRDSK